MADTPASDEPVRIAPERLRAFGEDELRAAGVSAEEARTVAWALTEANLEGIDTHGISRLAIYTRRVRAGPIAARPGLRWSHPAPAVALLDPATRSAQWQRRRQWMKRCGWRRCRGLGW